MNVPYSAMTDQQLKNLSVKLFGIDIGRSRVKGARGDGLLEIIPSYVWKHNPNDLDPEPTTLDKENLLVTYWTTDETGRRIPQKYWVGEKAKSKSMGRGKRMTASKVNNETLILALTMLFILGAHGETHITSGLPIDDYHNDANNLKKLLMGNHTIEVNGTRKDINIQTCGMFVEGAAHVKVSKYNGEGLLRVLDPGAKTTNYSTFYDGTYVPDQSGTLPYGWETHLKKGEDPELFANMIVSDLGQYGWEEADPIEVIGGRPHDLIQPLKNNLFTGVYIPDHIDTTFANALAYLAMLKEHMGVDDTI